MLGNKLCVCTACQYVSLAFYNAVVLVEYGGVVKDNKFEEFERFLRSRKIITTSSEEEESINREVIYS